MLSALACAAGWNVPHRHRSPQRKQGRTATRARASGCNEALTASEKTELDEGRKGDGRGARGELAIGTDSHGRRAGGAGRADRTGRPGGGNRSAQCGGGPPEAWAVVSGGEPPHGEPYPGAARPDGGQRHQLPDDDSDRPVVRGGGAGGLLARFFLAGGL